MTQPPPPERDLLLPYYEHPTARPKEWATILKSAPRLYGVVLNPASGPGTQQDDHFKELTANLREAGVKVLAYVDTDYARRPLREITADLADYEAWYTPDGVFFDQVTSTRDELPYYRAAARSARAAGCKTVVLNPGTYPHPAYARVADVLVTFEGTWKSYQALENHPRTDARHCHLIHGAPPEADCAQRAKALGATLHCAVPGTGVHPWGTFPHTLEQVR